VRLLTFGGLRLVAIGSVIGLAAAFVVARLLSGLLFGVNALDPLTFVAVPIVLATSAGLAAYLPARRASRVDPISALRAD
jgi:ABC-type antimicrobial peptide transport system permease subunit